MARNRCKPRPRQGAPGRTAPHRQHEKVVEFVSALIVQYKRQAS